MTRVKIVDFFNGYEGPSFTDYDEADQELAKNRHDFYAQPGLRNARFCQTIVPADYTWYFDQRYNKFLWGAPSKGVEA